MGALDRIRQALSQRPDELSQAKERGETVLGYFCCYIPEEIILALDLIPVRLGRGGDERLMDLGTRYSSPENCGFVRESLGLFAEGKDPYVAHADIVAVAGTCMQMYRLSELVNYYFHRPTVALGVPRNFYLPEGRDYFLESLKEFTAQLESLSGKRLDTERLQEATALCQGIRDCLRHIYQFQAQDSPPLAWRDVFEVIQAGFYLYRRHYLSLLQELLTEIEQAEPGPPDERPRIMLSGSLLAPGDSKLITLIEELGGRIVADDLCTGFRFWAGLAAKEASLSSIAHAYLDRLPCASLPCLLPYEEDRRFVNMLQMIKDYQVEGLIYHTLRFCDPFTFKATPTKRFLQEKAQIPFLEIHTEYSPSDVETIRSRLETFLDVVRSQKREKEVSHANQL